MIPYIFGLAAIGLVASLVLERPAQRVQPSTGSAKLASDHSSSESDE